MWPTLKRLLVEEQAQDIVEYALLTAAIGLAGAAAWPLVIDAIGDTYEILDRNQQDLWEPENPS